MAATSPSSRRAVLAHFVSTAALGTLAVFLAPDERFADAATSAVAAVVLLISVFAADAALSRSRSFDPSWAGFSLGASFAFFLRQAASFPVLAVGADRVTASAGLVALALVVRRVVRRRQSA